MVLTATQEPVPAILVLPHEFVWVQRHKVFGSGCIITRPGPYIFHQFVAAQMFLLRAIFFIHVSCLYFLNNSTMRGRNCAMMRSYRSDIYWHASHTANSGALYMSHNGLHIYYSFLIVHPPSPQPQPPALYLRCMPKDNEGYTLAELGSLSPSVCILHLHISWEELLLLAERGAAPS